MADEHSNGARWPPQTSNQQPPNTGAALAMPRLDLFNRCLPLSRGCVIVRGDLPDLRLLTIFSEMLILSRPGGQPPSHPTPPALPHTPNISHSNQMNSTSQSAGTAPEPYYSLLRPADASASGPSHSHFSGSAHQTSGMGLPSIMNATPMNNQPSASSSGYTLPPIPQQQSQSSTANL